VPDARVILSEGAHLLSDEQAMRVIAGWPTCWTATNLPDAISAAWSVLGNGWA